MDVEKSYRAVSWFFDSWVRIMEYQIRKMEAAESAQLGPWRFIVSPPTDAGIPLLTRANPSGRTDLLCFSNTLQRVAEDYIKKRQLIGIATFVEPFFRIPAPDESLSAVYANCLFDFCAEEDFDMVIREIWRVLTPGGTLFAVYITPSGQPGGRLWAWLFARLSFMIKGCHPVTIKANLTGNGFEIQKEMSLRRLGLPIVYSVSQRPITERAT